jgi:hypothetical protein
VSCGGQRMPMDGAADGCDVNTGGGLMMIVCEAWERLTG